MNTDKLRALERKWREEAAEMNRLGHTIDGDGLYAKANELAAALRAEQAVGTARQSEGVVLLSSEEARAIKGLASNLEHDAGDVDDLPPDQDDDEDAYWAYHSFHGLRKLLAAAPGGEGEVES